jgi:hypothetical protein
MRSCIAKVAISPAHVRAFKQERRASARRGWRKRICKGDTANVRETAAAGLANVVAITVAQPRGANAPLLYLVARAFLRKIATFAMHERKCARSSGRQPAVVYGNASARRYRKHAGDCPRCAGERHRNRGRRASVGSVPTDCAVPLRIRFRESRGAYAPRSCVARMRFCWGFASSAPRALPNHGG